MNLYLIQRIEDTDYDEVRGWVVRAPNAREARLTAQSQDRWHQVWTSPFLSTCVLIGKASRGDRARRATKNSNVVMRDFKAG